MMFIIIGLIVLMVIGILLCGNYENLFGLILAVILGIILFCAIICIPINYYEEKANINEYYMIKTSIEEARKNNINDVERAALTTKIIETNQWLSQVQYWNNTIFDIYIPDEVIKLQPLK